MRKGMFAAAFVGLAAGSASAQYLMVPDSTNDRIMLFSRADGSIVNLEFIPNAGGSPYQFQTAKEAIQVGNEIWVADQVADGVFRFTASLTPEYIGFFLVGNNIRGLAQVGDRVYVSNSQAGNGALARTIQVFDTSGTLMGAFDAPNDPFDVEELNGTLLVPEISTDDIMQYQLDGTPIGTFHNSDGVSGVDFPEQVHVAPTGANGALEVWVTGFTAPAGVYRYDSEGGQIAYYPVSTGPRGVFVLDNGQVMFTEGTTGFGVSTFDPATGAETLITVSTGCQFVGALNLTPPPQCDPDYDQNGVADQDDVSYLINVVGGGDNPTQRDPDFNCTGVADQDDITALIDVVAGGDCPC